MMAMASGWVPTLMGVPAVSVEISIGIISPRFGLTVESVATKAVSPFGVMAMASGASPTLIGVTSRVVGRVDWGDIVVPNSDDVGGAAVRSNRNGDGIVADRYGTARGIGACVDGNDSPRTTVDVGDVGRLTIGGDSDAIWITANVYGAAGGIGGSVNRSDRPGSHIGYVGGRSRRASCRQWEPHPADYREHSGREQ